MQIIEDLKNTGADNLDASGPDLENLDLDSRYEVLPVVNL
jgi:hypothetical protein